METAGRNAAAAPLDAAAGFYAGNTGLRLFRMSLAAAQKVAPALAVRAASRLFGTPLPPKWVHRRTPWDPAWKIERWPFEAASLTLYSPAVAPEAPVALLVHGWGGHARQMLPLAESLAQQGLRPLLLEMPAHGRSGGSVSNLPQFARAIEYAAARLAQQGFMLRVLAGHSLGANAAAFAASRGLALERLVLLAPPASPHEYTRYFARVFGLAESTRAAMQRRIETQEAVLMRQFEPASMGPRIRVPTLVVHDRGDRVNPFDDGRAFVRAIRGAQWLPTEDLGHRRILRDAHVLGRTALFCR